MRTEIAELTTELLAIANVTRKCNLIGNKKIAKAIKDSPFTKFEAQTLLEFIELFMQGTEKGVIIDTLQMSPELVKKFDKYDLSWQWEVER